MVGSPVRGQETLEQMGGISREESCGREPGNQAGEPARCLMNFMGRLLLSNSGFPRDSGTATASGQLLRYRVGVEKVRDRNIFSSAMVAMAEFFVSPSTKRRLPRWVSVG